MSSLHAILRMGLGRSLEVVFTCNSSDGIGSMPGIVRGWDLLQLRVRAALARKGFQFLVIFLPQMDPLER